MDRQKGTCIKRGILLDCINNDTGERSLIPIGSIKEIFDSDDPEHDGEIFISTAIVGRDDDNNKNEYAGVSLTYSLDEIADIIND